MIQGYNNSRIFDQLTNQKGILIQSNYEAVKKLEIGAMRFPGGTIARNYNLNLPGYDGRGKQYGGKNVLPMFIELIKEIKVPVTLVLNVGFYDKFFWNINKSRASEMLDNNKKLIESFLNSGIEIFCVELGNEEYLHIPKGNVVPPNIKYNAIQKALKQTKDDKFREEILGYYKMYTEIYHTHSQLVESFGLESAVPMPNNSTYKWQLFNQCISEVKAKYGVWHHYESEPESVWKDDVDSFITDIQSQGRIPVCTEWAIGLGDQGNQNLNLANNGYKEKFEKWFVDYVRSRGDVPLIMKHRLGGNPISWNKNSGGIPYDWM